MAACGSDDISLKGDADEGCVELSLGDDTYTRRLQRRSNTVITDGDPYLEDAELADLFAFLLESNKARRAVSSSQNLHDIIMDPIDTEEIKAEIDELTRTRQGLKNDLEGIEDLKEELPSLEEKRTQLREEIDRKQFELESTEEELKEANANIEETREDEAELEKRLDELQSKRSTLDDVRYNLETEQGSIKSLKQEKQELQDELEELPETPSGEVNDIETSISQFREEKQVLESEVSELQSVIGFNEEMLEESSSDLFDALTGEETEEGLTDQLLEADEVVCWTCSSQVPREQVESTVGQLRQLSQKKIGRINELEDDIDELVDERQKLERAQRERNRINDRLREIETEIDGSNAEIERLQERREVLTEEIEALEQEVEKLENDDYNEIIDLHREANQLEYDIGRLESELENANKEIESIESRIDERDDIEQQLEVVEEKISDLRTQIDRIENRAAEEFNEHMDTVLELLNYANLDRIWIEKIEREVREGRRTVNKSIFELHVVRTTESGTAYEDTVNHLSESEREVTGLIFALAGYLAHEVHERTPLILLDSLEAIDPERIATLVEYLEDYTGYLIVALLPEDAMQLNDRYSYINEIG